MDEFDIGDMARLEVQWIADGVPVAATTQLAVRDPAGNLVEYSGGQVLSPATGVYRVTVGPLQIAGAWHFRFEASGAFVAAEESSFYVRASRVR